MVKTTVMCKDLKLSMVASLVGSDRRKGIDGYMLINKYTGPLPQVVTISKEVVK